jgi:hypothetical protein
MKAALQSFGMGVLCHLRSVRQTSVATLAMKAALHSFGMGVWCHLRSVRQTNHACCPIESSSLAVVTMHVCRSQLCSSTFSAQG